MNVKAHLYKATCWKSQEKWYTNDVTNLSCRSSKWYTPMRILGISIEEYINLLIKFSATSISYYAQTDYLHFYFNSEKDAKAFCSYINKIAKNKNYYCV